MAGIAVSGKPDSGRQNFDKNRIVRRRPDALKEGATSGLIALNQCASFFEICVKLGSSLTWGEI
jgi:hypothetical protein